jgi:mono/diheme cytochrome c family protein
MASFWRIFPGPGGLLTLVVLGAGCQRGQAEGDTRAEARQLFDSACAKCHGRDGRGGVPAAEGLPAPSNLRDPAFQASRTDEQLKQVIKHGKGPMPPFGVLFDEAQTTQLVAYIRSFAEKR